MLISWGGEWGRFCSGRAVFWCVPERDRMSGEYVSLGMGHSFVKGYHWS